MKKSELTQLFHALNTLKNAPEESNIKFRYCLKKNLSSLDPEIKVLREIEEEDKKILKDMFDERDNFIKEKGKTDAQGNKFIPINEANPSEEDKKLVEDFKKLGEELEEKYKEQIETFNKKNEEYVKMLQETEVGNEIKLFKINLENCPDWASAPQYVFATDILIDAGVIIDLKVV